MQGNRFGHWMELNGFNCTKELYRAFWELYPDEQQPAICFLDWEDIPVHFISETYLSENLFGLLTGLREMDNTQKLGFSHWLGRHGQEIPATDAGVIIRAFEMCYQGYFGYKQRFTEYYAENELGITKKSSPRFDFRTFTNFLFSGLYLIDCGFVFRKVKYEFKNVKTNGEKFGESR